MELVIGKWYTGKFDDFDCIGAKCKEYKGNNYLYFSEAIRTSKGYFHYGSGSWDYPKNIREMTQEELKQYLPEGHPDLQIENNLIYY